MGKYRTFLIYSSLFLAVFSSKIDYIDSFASSEEQNAIKIKNQFDPDDCYEPGTNFDENQKNLGYCPCKYGYGGPRCFDIFDCVIGELRTDNCSRPFRADFDLQWRCAASQKTLVKICTCPYGFRGETCEYILENTPSTYWMALSQSQKFFEIVYNKSHGLPRIIGTKIVKTILEYRRIIMILIFVLVLELAWRSVKRMRRNRKNFNENQENGKILSGNLKKNDEKKCSFFRRIFCNQQKKYEELKPIPKFSEKFEKMNENCKELDNLSQSSLPSYHTVVDETEKKEENSEELKIHRPHIHV